MFFWQPGERDGVIIDGHFNDWSGVAVTPDNLDDQSTNYNVNLIAGALQIDSVYLSVYIETEESLFSGSMSNLLRVFIDSDADSSSGYDYRGIGADHLLELSGSDTIVKSSYLYVWDNSRGRTDWNGFVPLSTVNSYVSSNKLETQIPLFDLGLTEDQAVAVLLQIRDTSGNEDVLDSPIIIGGQALERVFLPTSELPLPEEWSTNGIIHLKANSDLTLDWFELELGGTYNTDAIEAIELELPDGSLWPCHGYSDIQICDGQELVLEPGVPVELAVRVHVSPLAEAGTTLDLAFSEMEFNGYVYSMPAELPPRYLLADPNYIAIDGLFIDWHQRLTGSDPAGDVENEDIDLLDYGELTQDQQLFFYLHVAGEILAGSEIPADVTRHLPADQMETPPEIPEAAVTQQSQAPLPVNTGEDQIWILLDVVPGDGYRISPFVSADYAIHIHGWTGKVLDQQLMQFSGSSDSDWSWTPYGEAMAASGGSELEAALVLDDLPAIPRAVHFHLVDWEERADDATSVGGSFETVITPDTGRGGDSDPFAIDLGGSIYYSSDGEDWESKTSPVTGYHYVDVAAGSENTAGYVYVLRSDGRVDFTQSGPDDWVRYGYGSDAIPSSDAYVGIAIGSENTAGYVYVLRSDGNVYFTQNGPDGWVQYGYGSSSIPAGHYVDIAAGSGSTAGYVYVLRNDGNVYFTQSGPDGWVQYGYGSDSISSSTGYVSLTTGSDSTAGYVYVLRSDGAVYFTQNGPDGWTLYGYGSDSISSSTGYVDISADGRGGVQVIRNDGKIYYTQNGPDGWVQYGYGSTNTLPTSNAWCSVAAVQGRLAGYVFALRNDGNVYFTQSGPDDWVPYGYGSTLSHSPTVADLAWDSTAVYVLLEDGTVKKSTDTAGTWSSFGDAGSDTDWASLATGDGGYLYALAADGQTARTSTSGSASWSSYGDAGSGTGFLSLAATSDYVYAMVNDGTVRYATSSSGVWGSKGDVGSGLGWVALASYNDDMHLYAMSNERAVYRSSSGTSTSWSSWASADSGSASWVGLGITSTYLFALRADGRVDRATIGDSPSWTEELGDAGSDNAFVAFGTAIPEFATLLLPIASVILIVGWNNRRRRLSGRQSFLEMEKNNEL